MFALPLLLILVLTVISHYQIYVQLAHEKIKRNDSLNIELLNKTTDNILDNIVSDVLFLSEYNETNGNFDSDNLTTRINIIDEFITFAKSKKRYDQIRYIDNGGKEIVRINYNSGIPIAVPSNLLQEKKARYYVNKTLQLNKKEIYWSSFDLKA